MSKGLKILLGVLIFFALISGIFLLFAKTKTTPTATNQTAGQITKSANVNLNTNGQVSTSAPSVGLPVQSETTSTSVKTPSTANIPAGQTQTQTSTVKTPTNSTTSTATDAKTNVNGQWQQCKAKTMPIDTNLFWNVQISEGIPLGGTYAKGNLNSDKTLLVHVIVKSDSKIADKIKSFLIPGKMAFLRGNCTGVADDGAVILQAF